MQLKADIGRGEGRDGGGGGQGVPLRVRLNYGGGVKTFVARPRTARASTLYARRVNAESNKS